MMSTANDAPSSSSVQPHGSAAKEAAPGFSPSAIFSDFRTYLTSTNTSLGPLTPLGAIAYTTIHIYGFPMRRHPSKYFLGDPPKFAAGSLVVCYAGDIFLRYLGTCIELSKRPKQSELL